jgi:hypothetical protein
VSLFRERQAVVESEGRRFICRPPTVETLDLAFLLFGDEIVKLARAYYVEGGGWLFGPEEDLIPLFIADARGAFLLATCVDAEQRRGASKHELFTSRPLRLLLASACVGLCDFESVLDGLKLGDVLDMAAEPGELSGIDSSVLVVARSCGLSPFEVMRWPMDSFVSVVMNLRAAPEGKEKKDVGRWRPIKVDPNEVLRPLN